MANHSVLVLCVVLLAGITLAVIPEVHAQERSTESPDFEIPQPPENQDRIQIDEHSEYTFDAMIINLGDTSYRFTLEPPSGQQASGHVPAPDGATITPQGAFSWTPSEEHGGSTYTIYIYMIPEGQNPIVKQLRLGVMEANQNPILEYIPDIPYAPPGDRIRLQINATDDDIIGNGLRYVLDPPWPEGATSGATLDRSTGVFSWTPTSSQKAYHTFIVRVWDGSPARAGTTTQSFVIIVADRLDFNPPFNIKYTWYIREHTEYTFDLNVTNLDNIPYRFELESSPEGATITPEGRFSWMPNESQGGASYLMRINMIPEGRDPISKLIKVYVLQTNKKPEVEHIQDLRALSGSEIRLQINATDYDFYDDGLRYVLDPPKPAGAILNRSSGVFTWTPNSNQIGDHTINVRVWDGSPIYRGTARSFNITVLHPPDFYLPQPPQGQSRIEVGDIYEFNTMVTNPSDIPYSFTLNPPLGQQASGHVPAPDGATITSQGRFSWMPSEDQDNDNHTIYIYMVPRGFDPIVKQLHLRVPEINHSPTAKPTEITVTAGESAMINLQDHILDSEQAIDTLDVSIPTQPGQGTADVSGIIITYTARDTASGTDTFDYTVTDDGGLSDTAAIAVAINALILPGDIQDQTIDEDGAVDYEIPVRNPDNQNITWSVTSSPMDAEIDHNGRFTWSPTEDDGGKTHPFYISAEATTNTINYVLNVTVDEANQDPKIDDGFNPDQLVKVGDLFTFDLDATDPDTPAQTISYDIISQSPSDNQIALDSRTGMMTWTPTTVETRTITVRASDSHMPAGTVDITVTITALPPLPTILVENNGLDPKVIDVLGSDHVNAGLRITEVTPSLGNPDRNYEINHTGTHVTYMPGSGISHDTKYLFEYAASYGRYTDTAVLIVSVYMAPVLVLPDSPIIDEMEPYSFDVMVTDPAQDISMYELVGAPDGAMINPDNGTFSWTPTEEQGPGTYTFSINAANEYGLEGTKDITVTVNEVNRDPTILPISPIDDVQPDTPVGFTVIAMDPDPGTTLRYELRNHPAGAMINPTTGQFSWTPSDDQTGAHTFTVHVSDDYPSNPGTAEEQVTITVGVNMPPSLTPPVRSYDLTEREVFFTTPYRSVTDDAFAGYDTLTYSLSESAPGTMTVNPGTGRIDWTPSTGDAGRYSFLLTVSDGQFSDTMRILITVAEAPAPQDDFVTTGINASIVIFPLENDGLGAGLSVVREPSHGELTVSGDAVLYIPETGYTGDDRFRYRMSYTGDSDNTYPAWITVTMSANVTNLPELEEISRKKIAQFETLTFNVMATYPEGSSVRYMLFDNPDGATITRDGVFSWTPTEEEHLGKHDIAVVVGIVSAYDDNLIADTQKVRIRVTP